MHRIIVPALTASLLGLGTGCGGETDLPAVFGGEAGRWIDLTYSFSDQTIYWPTGCACSPRRTISCSRP